MTRAAVALAVAGLVFLEWRSLPGLAEAQAMLAAPRVPPSPAGFAAVWAHRLLGFGVFAAFQLACLGWGRGFARLVRLRPDPWTWLPLGWGAAGIAAFGISLAGIAYPVVILATLLAVPASILLAPARTTRSRRGRPARSGKAPRVTGGLKWALVSAGVAFVLAALAALAPEVEGDPLSCHYANPLRVLALHRLVEWPFTIHDDYPWLWEMLLLPLLGIAGEGPTRWFPPFLLAWLGTGVFRIARTGAGTAWAGVAAALLVSNPFLARQAVSAKNDLLVACMCLAAFRCARSGAATTAGILAGMAATAKYNGGASLIVAAAALAAVRRWKPAAYLRLGGAFAVVLLPLLLRNVAATGDPVFPFGQGILGGPFVSEASRMRLREHLFLVTEQDASLITPLRTIAAACGFLNPEESFARWLFLLPLVALVRAWPAGLRAAGWSLAILLAAWAAGPPQIRYAAAAFPFAALLAAAGLASLPRRLGTALATGAVLLQLLHVAGSPPVADALRAGLGLEDREAWRERRLTSTLAMARGVNALAGPRDRVVLIGENRTALFVPRTDFAAFGEAAFPPFPAIRDSDGVRRAWTRLRRQNGWTIVVYNRLSAFFWRRNMADDAWTASRLERWCRLWDAHAEPAWESPMLDIEQGYFYVWRLVPSPRSRSRAAIPGLEGWVWRMEQEIREARLDGVARDFRVMRRAAGEYALVDVVEAGMFRDRLRPGEREALLRRAVERGWKSPSVALELAALAERDGRQAEAIRWWREACALEPALARRMAPRADGDAIPWKP